MSLGNHLRAHEQVEFTFMQSCQNAFEVLTPAYCVAIESPNARLRKHSVQQLLQLLRTRTEEMNVLTAAMDTMLWNWRSVAAIVTLHFPGPLVMSQRNRAVLALQLLPAGST